MVKEQRAAREQLAQRKLELEDEDYEGTTAAPSGGEEAMSLAQRQLRVDDDKARCV